MRAFARRSIVALLGALLLATAGPALAAWTVPSTGAASFGKARTMPGGNTPTTNVNGRNVVVSWTAAQFPNGVNADGYIVKRYAASTGAVQAMQSACNGSISGLTCTENSIPPGNWQYTVTPRKGNWMGTESAKSGTATVGNADLSFITSTTVTSLEATLAGTISNFEAGQNVVFRLDNPNTGTQLATIVNPVIIPLLGTAAVTVTIPKGVTNGTHTVYAVGDQGDVASQSINVNVTPPSPSALAWTNINQAGRAETDDAVAITFSQPLDVGSLCSTWSGDAANQSVAADNVVTVRIQNDAAPSGNDLLDVSTSAAACSGQFHFGSIDLGETRYVTGNTTFVGTGTGRSSIAWNPTTRQLTITLGTKATGGNPGRVNSSVTATYTPDPAIRNTSWTPITGTTSFTGVQF